jgi:hypothetical protein
MQRLLGKGEKKEKGQKVNKKKYFPTEDDLRVIREHYDGTTVKINKIMRILNAAGPKYPRWHIRHIAQSNGWARTKEPNWSTPEIKWLAENYPRKGMVALQNGLKRINGGILRTRTAIVLKKKRIHINKRSDGLTMRMMEDLLGSDHHKVKRWMKLGLLEAKRKGTDRKEIQGGDMWHFEILKVRKFIISNPTEIDIRRVEPVSFIHLVSGMMS